MSDETAQAPTIIQPQAPANPFQRQNSDHVSAGAVAIESERAIAEAQAKMVIAKRFPRDPYMAVQRIMDACSREGLANEAFYSYDRGGSKVTGPSIRLAEVMASAWGNIEYGINELSRRDGESEMQAYCWDLETNTFSQQKFTVAHIRDTRGGGRELKEQRDIYEIGANMGARRLRARILAIIPKDVIDAAVDTCKATIAGRGQQSFDSRLKKMVAAFNGIGVTLKMIEARLEHKLADTTVDDLTDLVAVFNSVKSGEGKIGDYFGPGVSVAAPRDESPAARQETAPAAAAKPVKIPETASGAGAGAGADAAKPAAASAGRGRPSKEDVEAATAQGAADFKAGAPLDACPEERPSIMAAWREGWQSAKDAASSGQTDSGAPFDDDEADGDAAPALPEPGDTAAASGDDEPDIPAGLRHTAEPASADGDDDGFSFGE